MPGTDVTVRLFAAARVAAGTAELHVAPGPIDEVIAALAEGRDGRFSQVLSISTLISDGVRLDRHARTPVPAGAVIDVLPPFAGG